MSLRLESVGEIPVETVHVAQAAFPKGTLVTRLRDEFSTLYQDEDFRSLYPARGQPTLTPWRLALVTVFQFLEHLSDRQAADAVRARINWKYALGLELTDPGFHFSVLAEFRARLVAGGAEHLLLDTMLERFKAAAWSRRGASSAPTAHTCWPPCATCPSSSGWPRRSAPPSMTWPRSRRTGCAVAKPVWFERYGRRVEEDRLPKSREEREALALVVGADGFVLLDALDAPDAPAATRELPMVRTLRDVWRVHYARDDGRPRWRGVAELPPVAERVQSPYDPEAHFSLKRQFGWTGSKVHVTEACDDDAAHLITPVMSRPAMRPDMASTAEIHERLAAKGLLPSEHFVDSGYVDAGLLAGSRRDHGLSLEGPVRGVLSRVGHGYELRHLAIDWDGERVTCPRGKASVSWRTIRAADGGPRIQALFSRTDCGACPARAMCTPATSPRRPVPFHPREEDEALNAARARMADPAWVERYRRRAGVEGTLSRGVRAFGMRRSRYIGLAKTGLQQVCTAAAINVSRVVHWLNGRPRAKTRVTRFAALAAAA
jgi:transposase